MALDGGVHLAQAQLLSRTLAKPTPQRVGAAAAIQQGAPFRDVPGRGAGTSGTCDAQAAGAPERRG